MALLIVLCLFAPFPLLALEIFLPFPYLVEELFKYFIIRSMPRSDNYSHPILLGIVFSISETFLYLVNFFQLGDFSNLPLRLFITTMLHTFTVLLFYTFRSQRHLSILSLLIAMIIHFFFNFLVT